jgi:hypothetical protein
MLTAWDVGHFKHLYHSRASMSLFSFSFTSTEVVLFLFVALFIGMSKTGVHGVGMIAVPMLAVVFGGQLSSGVMLPMLCLAGTRLGYILENSFHGPRREQSWVRWWAG